MWRVLYHNPFSAGLRAVLSSLAAGEKVGLAAYLLAVIFLWIDMRLSAVPLALFVLLCAVAPFFPSLPFFLPVVSRGRSGGRAVAVTFDDGPDPLTTRPLLALLSKHRVSAAFFINGGNAARYPELLREILARGHEVGNHTYTHNNLIMLKNRRYLKQEIQETQRVFDAFGIRALAFRPPVGVTNPRLGGVLRELGMYAVNFSLRPGDAGNRRLKGLAGRILKKVRSDDIILLHEKIPGDPNRIAEWLSELDRLFEGLRQRDIAVLPLSALIGRTVTESRPRSSDGADRA